MSMMTARLTDMGRRAAGMALGALAALAMTAAPVAAQDLETFDPDAAYAQQQDGAGAIDADLANPQAPPSTAVPVPAPTDPAFDQTFEDYAAPPAAQTLPPPADGGVAPVTAASQNAGQTYGEDDLIGAAEAGGAFIVGARYGSGTLHHKVEGTQPVYWTGPSIGFDAGANAANTFVLVYNLYDSEDLFKRFPAGEGQAYFVGGLHASYLRRGDTVLIPIRVGAGLRLGVNAGYMKFSKKQRWLPF